MADVYEASVHPDVLRRAARSSRDLVRRHSGHRWRTLFLPRDRGSTAARTHGGFAPSSPAQQAPEAGGAHRLWNEFFFSAPQLRRILLDGTDRSPEIAVNAWETVILTGFHSLGGEAGLQALYKFLEKDTPLPRQHLRATRYGGRPAYQHQVRSHVSNLCDSGDLRRVERGRYAITQRGRARLQRTASELRV
jgi:hypothetical protein